MSSQKEEPKYIWSSDRTLTDYGASLIARIPTLQTQINELKEIHRGWIDQLFNRVIQLEDTVMREVLIPRATTAIGEYLNLHPDSRMRNVIDSLRTESNRLWNASLELAWEKLEHKGLIEGKSPQKGRPRLWRVKPWEIILCGK